MESNDPLTKLIQDRFDILEEYLLKQCANIKARLDAIDMRLDDIETQLNKMEHQNSHPKNNKKWLSKS
jgi:ribosome-associated translation inhibitor RaiA